MSAAICTRHRTRLRSQSTSPQKIKKEFDQRDRFSPSASHPTTEIPSSPIIHNVPPFPPPLPTPYPNHTHIDEANIPPLATPPHQPSGTSTKDLYFPTAAGPMGAHAIARCYPHRQSAKHDTFGARRVDDRVAKGRGGGGGGEESTTQAVALEADTHTHTHPHLPMANSPQQKEKSPRRAKPRLGQVDRWHRHQHHHHHHHHHHRKKHGLVFPCSEQGGGGWDEEGSTTR